MAGVGRRTPPIIQKGSPFVSRRFFMQRLKIIVLVFLFLIAGIVAVSLWVSLEERRAFTKKEKIPEVQIEGLESRMEKIQLVEDKGGKKTWELEAKSIEQAEETKVFTLRDVKVTYYSKDGRIIIVTGRQGKVNQDSRDVELVGDVVLSTSDGYRVKTNAVSYNHQAKKVTSSDPVEIEGTQVHLVGKGLYVDLEAQTFKVLGRVKTHIKRRVKG